MIRLVIDYPVCPIDLFEKHYPEESVRECHFSKTYPLVSSFVNAVGKSERPAYYEYDMAPSPEGKPAYPVCKLRACVFFPAYCQSYHVGIIRNIFFKA